MKIYVNIPEFYHENCSSCWTKFIKEQAKDTIVRIMEEEKCDLFYDDGQNKLFPYKKIVIPFGFTGIISDTLYKNQSLNFYSNGKNQTLLRFWRRWTKRRFKKKW